MVENKSRSGPLCPNLLIFHNIFLSLNSFTIQESIRVLWDKGLQRISNLPVKKLLLISVQSSPLTYSETELYLHTPGIYTKGRKVLV